MIYLVQQIILCLLFTAIIGVAAGWLLRGLGTSRQTEAVEARWRARLEQVEQRAATQSEKAPDDAQRKSTPQPAGTPAAAPQQGTPDSASNEQLDELRRKLAESERELGTLRTAQAVRARAEPSGETTQEQLRESRIVAQQLQTSLLEQNSISDRLEKKLERAEQEKKSLVDRLRNTEARNAELAQERQHAMDMVTSLQREVRTLHNTAEEQREATAQATAQAAQLKAKAQRAGSGSDSPQRRLPIAESAEPEVPEYEPQWQLSEPDGKADNLQAIYGIGPKTEQRLNALGIFHFRQLGAFKKRDIVWLTQHLHGIPGRISRDRWVEQARAMEKRRQAGQPI